MWVKWVKVAWSCPTLCDTMDYTVHAILHARILEWVSQSVSQFSCSVVSDSLWPQEPQHARPPCPSPNPRVYPNSCPLNWWCHLTISSSIVPFSSCLQSFPISHPTQLLSFQMSQLFTSGGQSIGVSASASALPMNIQDWFPLGWTSWISLQSKGLLETLLQYLSSKASIFLVLSFLYSPTLTSTHDYWENHSFDGLLLVK